MIFESGKSYHMRVDPGGLRHRPMRELEELAYSNGMTMGVFMAKLKRDAEAGIFYPMGDCDNFDPHTGCLGHPMEGSDG